MPGFRATVEYSVTAYVDKGILKKAATSILPKQQNRYAKHQSHYWVETKQRAATRCRRPSSTIPDRAPLSRFHHLWSFPAELRVSLKHPIGGVLSLLYPLDLLASVISLPRYCHPWRSMLSSDQDAQLYVPASRVFSMTEPIPFHLTLTSSAYSLAAFMPYGPTPSLLSPNKQHTRIKLLRQSIVDVR